jgi:hypothetical protein
MKALNSYDDLRITEDYMNEFFTEIKETENTMTEGAAGVERTHSHGGMLVSAGYLQDGGLATMDAWLDQIN